MTAVRARPPGRRSRHSVADDASRTGVQRRCCPDGVVRLTSPMRRAGHRPPLSPSRGRRFAQQQMAVSRLLAESVQRCGTTDPSVTSALIRQRSLRRPPGRVGGRLGGPRSCCSCVRHDLRGLITLTLMAAGGLPRRVCRPPSDLSPGGRARTPSCAASAARRPCLRRVYLARGGIFKKSPSPPQTPASSAPRPPPTTLPSCGLATLAGLPIAAPTLAVLPGQTALSSSGGGCATRWRAPINPVERRQPRDQVQGGHHCGQGIWLSSSFSGPALCAAGFSKMAWDIQVSDLLPVLSCQ